MGLREKLKKVLPLPAKRTCSEFNKVRKDLNTIKKSTNQFFDAARSLGDSQDAIGDRIDLMEGLLGSQADALSEHSESLGGLSQALATLNALSADMLKKLDTIDNSVDGAASVVVRIAAATDGVRNDVSVLNSKLWDNARSVVLCEAAAMPRHLIEHLDYHLVDHCNLNCRCCSTYSPIAPEKFADLETFRVDLERLHDILGDKVLRLHLLGGEPLLHPDVESFMRVAREVFPIARIDVTTNGLMVAKMSDSFWNTMASCDIELKYTHYPVGVNYDALVARAKEHAVFAYSAGEGEIKCFRRIPLNPKGASNVHQTYLRCPYVDCPQLREGLLYRCPASAYADILNEAMRADGRSECFRRFPMDYLDLSESLTEVDVFEFLSRPIPFCQYCDMAKIDNSIPWGGSSRSISEWVDL
ncbi:radical SAM protein [Adlercreutzia equolifaciens]|uniref:radical SAM protein n=1 Tax=Adlercreutzia equolifaciens TaxID=446660 RepID=UPI0022E35A33|nr:radical SAM protein [Adlercreutzia equolifaciens]